MNHRTLTFAFIFVSLSITALNAQVTLPPPAETTAPGGPIFQIHANSVLVPVVVRDAQSHAVGDLKQEDFKIFDQGKRRTIVGFTLQQSVKTEASPSAPPASTSVAPNSAPAAANPAQSSTTTKRSIVFLFDDRHLGPGDLEQVKKAGIRMLEKPLADGDRAVVLSFRGVNSGITHDHVPLQTAISNLKPQQINQRDRSQCPDIDYYTADQILNKHSKTEWDVAYEQAANCSHKSYGAGPSGGTGYVEQLVRTAANQALLAGDQDVRETLIYLRDVVHTMTKFPGQRTLILVSPGFYTGTDEALAMQSSVLNVAAASNVVISVLDARGLGGSNVGAGSNGSVSVFANMTGQPIQSQLESARANEYLMSELADGTGGTYFRHSNDLEGGLESLAAGPEFLYLLEFSLQDVKANSSYHQLKVEVAGSGLSVKTRAGYFAPSPPGKNQ